MGLTHLPASPNVWKDTTDHAPAWNHVDEASAEAILHNEEHSLHWWDNADSFLEDIFPSVHRDAQGTRTGEHEASIMTNCQVHTDSHPARPEQEPLFLSVQDILFLQQTATYPVRNKEDGKIYEYRVGEGDPSFSIHAFIGLNHLQEFALYFTNDSHDARYVQQTHHYALLSTNPSPGEALRLLPKKEALAYFQSKY